MRIFQIALVALAVSAPALAWADPPGPHPGGDRGGHDERHEHQKRSRLLREKLGLADDKARRIEAIMERYAPERRRAMQAIRDSRSKLRSLVSANSEDQAAYRATLDQLRKNRTALVGVMDRAFAEVAKELSPKEQAKLFLGLEEFRAKMKGHKHGRGPGGGGGDDDDD